MACPKKTENNFKPRSLVEIAFAAEKVRQDTQKSHDQNNMSQSAVSQNDPAAQNLPSSGSEQSGSALPGLSEPVADVPQISEEQAASNTLQAHHEADLTALRAELAVQQQLAEKQAYDLGVTAGIEAAKSAEPSEEERALDERRQAEHRNVIARLEACVASASGPDAVDEQQIAAALQTAVMHLASERAGVVISENPEGIIARIASLAERVKQKSETIIVALHPEDLKALTAYGSGPLGWKYVADEALLSGDIRISLDTIDIADILIAAPQKRTQIAQQSADEEPDIDAGAEPEPDTAPEVDLGTGGVMGVDVKGDVE
ncbi:FliH/SctL family protein [Alphaproteobacteria bacterium]|nr:FliH/SctL family protein [Alphaproteobacteria bacterium]